MNKLKNNFSGSNSNDLCECESEVTKLHFYESSKFNCSIKNVPDISMFEKSLCEMIYFTKKIKKDMINSPQVEDNHH